MAWQPNGLGAQTDNSVAGGAGGYLAIPQPPQPPNLFPSAPVNSKPESYGQFGPLSYTYLSAGGNTFVIYNPGRSQ